MTCGHIRVVGRSQRSVGCLGTTRTSGPSFPAQPAHTTFPGSVSRMPACPELGRTAASCDRSHRQRSRPQEVMSTPTTYRGDDRRAGEELTGAAGRTGAQRPVPLAAGVIEFMIRLSTERRRFPAALTLAALLLGGPAFTSTTTAQAREEGVPSYFCDFDWRKGTWHVKQLIRCAEDRWSVPGGASGRSGGGGGGRPTASRRHRCCRRQRRMSDRGAAASGAPCGPGGGVERRPR